MHILISWATWFLWVWLTKQLLAHGHTITVVSRNHHTVQKYFGDTVSSLQREEISTQKLQWTACIIHLAWAPIDSFPWTKSTKDTIYNSRIDTTRLLVNNLPSSCHTFICGSATWYYPSSPEHIYETSFINTSPSSFLETVCVDREHEAKKGQSSTTRVVHLRTWLVIGPQKLDKQLRLVTKWFGGIVLWSWQQRMPCISVDEWRECCIAAVHDWSVHGPINMVTYNKRHKEYIQSLAKELHRPVWLRIPARIIKLFLGSMASITLWSWHVKPHSKI